MTKLVCGAVQIFNLGNGTHAKAAQERKARLAAAHCAISMALLLLAGCSLPAFSQGEDSSEQPLYQAGSYTGRATGYSDELEVTVTLTGSHIDEIRVPSCPETKGIGAVAVEQLPGMIVANQTLKVDVVAGATETSRALLTAVEEAIASSGADMTALLEEPQQPITPTLSARVTPADLIVVGAGGAGLTAALSAKQQNPDLNIVLLEKTAAPGGNTRLAGDGINAADSDAQRKQEIEDDFEAMLADSVKGSGELQNPALLEILAGDSASALDWLTEQGIVLEAVTALPGSSAERAHRPENGVPVGQALIEGLTDAVQKAGIRVLYRTEAISILTDEQGAISGVVAQSPGERHLFTGRAVVLATGGFAANDKLCGSYRTILRGLDTVSAPSATGDGISMAQELGAATADMSQIVTEPTVHRGSGAVVPCAMREQGAILVNSSGERFVDELLSDREISDALLAQSGRSGWMIFGEGLRPLLSETLAQAAFSSDDPAMLAKMVNLPEEVFFEEIENRNAELPATIDDAENESHPARLEGKLYALAVAPGIKTTLGGLMITAQAEVVGADGEPIEGLYAAGEVTGGIHGEVALPGNSLTELVVFGRRAGSEAANDLTSPEKAEESSDV